MSSVSLKEKCTTIYQYSNTKKIFFLNLKYFFLVHNRTPKITRGRNWGDIGADCWFTEVSAPAAPCVLPYTAFPGFCETNLLWNKTDSKSEVSIWATPWKQTLLIYNTAFLVWDMELHCGEGARQAPASELGPRQSTRPHSSTLPRKWDSWEKGRADLKLCHQVCSPNTCARWDSARHSVSPLPELRVLGCLSGWGWDRRAPWAALAQPL